MADIDWETIAKREGWKEVEADPRPEWSHTGPCLYHEDQERAWPLGDWKGAACDLGVDPDTGLYGDEQENEPAPVVPRF